MAEGPPGPQPCFPAAAASSPTLFYVGVQGTGASRMDERLTKPEEKQTGAGWGWAVQH